MRITWASDVHLELCSEFDRRSFYAQLARSRGDAILLSGDIASHNQTGEILNQMQAATGKKIFHILGNHDFYRSSFKDVTSTVDAFCARNPELIRLDNSNPIPIGHYTCLVGHGGWACGTAGSGIHTPVQINDKMQISDLRRLSQAQLFSIMRLLAQQSVDHIRAVGRQAAEEYLNVWIGTHTPPFIQSCTYDGAPTEPHYLPHFCNLQLGNAILELASAYPKTRFTILCGHTHSMAFFSPTSNVRVITAEAEYRHPAISAELDSESEARKDAVAWQSPPLGN